MPLCWVSLASIIFWFPMPMTLCWVITLSSNFALGVLLTTSWLAGQLWSWLSFRKIDDSPRVCLTGEKHWGKTKEKRGKFPGKKRSNFNIRCWDLGHSHVVILIDTAEPGGDSIYETCSAGDIEMKCARTQLSDSSALETSRVSVLKIHQTFPWCQSIHRICNFYLEAEL